MEQEQLKNIFNSEIIKIKRVLILLDFSQKTSSKGRLIVKCPKMFFAKFFAYVRVLQEKVNENDVKKN